MPEVMEIKSAIELGRTRKQNRKFIWLACSICKQGEWVEFYRAKKAKFKRLCVSCSIKARYPEPKCYRVIMIPSDSPFAPMASPHNHTTTLMIQEHRLVMAQHVGRCLTRDEIIHHKNGNVRDNRIENLELVSHGENIQYAFSYRLGYTNGYKQGFTDAKKKSS